MPLLKLPDFNVLDHSENGHDIQIKVETAAPPEVCQKCLRTDSEIVGYGRRKNNFLDTPIRGKRVGLLVDRRKFMCRTCGATFLENLGDMDTKRNMTTRYDRHAFGRMVAFDTHVVNYGTHISTLLSKIESGTL